MTKYLINRDGLYLADNPSLHHWTEEQDKAKQFDFMVSADCVAIMELGLSIEDYTIELVEA